jgi:hypothetical protein
VAENIVFNHYLTVFSGNAAPLVDDAIFIGYGGMQRILPQALEPGYAQVIRKSSAPSRAIWRLDLPSS